MRDIFLHPAEPSTRRPGDFVFRYDGEAFCILCSGVDAGQALYLSKANGRNRIERYLSA